MFLFYAFIIIIIYLYICFNSVFTNTILCACVCVYIVCPTPKCPFGHLNNNTATNRHSAFKLQKDMNSNTL
uniref:Uncharacterized protein n=1 Tax=Anguilla anguilla TaxID=7936 RepID=A0A0E9SRD1_ANGAN